MPKRYYIAYGSNLNIRQMRWRCPTARIIGTAELVGWRLLFKGSKTGSYLTIEPFAGSRVPIAVWDVTPEDELALDHYEGYPSFYYKKELTLDIKGIKTGRSAGARCLCTSCTRIGPSASPAALMLRPAQEGYHDFGFDTDFLTEALNYSMEAVK